MQIHKINKNKLEVLITEQDLTKNNINPQDFMACKIQNDFFLTKIIKYANHEFGFSFKNCEIIVESFSIPSLKAFVIDITTTPKKIHINKNSRFKLHCYFVAKFYLFGDLCAFCNSIDFNNTASLYFLDNAYYLSIKVIHINEYKKILMNLKEFSDSFSTQYFINEFSNLIIKDKAISICKKFC